MNTFYTIFFFLLIPLLGYGQNMTEKQGESLIRQSLDFFDKYYAEGKYKEAAEYANTASKAAENIGNNKYQAIALNWHGKALMKIQNAKKTVLNRAYKSLQESNRLTNDKVLRMDNLQHMRELATKMNNRRKLERAERDIAVLKGEKKPATDSKGGLFNRRKQAMKMYLDLKEERVELSEELLELSEEQALMRKQQGILLDMIQQKERPFRK